MSKKKMILYIVAALFSLSLFSCGKPDVTPSEASPSVSETPETPDTTESVEPDTGPSVLPENTEPSNTPEPISKQWPGSHTYEIRACLHESMPEYRFVATGIRRSEDEWAYGYVMGLEVYDENGSSVLSADFSQVLDGELTGYPVYNEMMDTMGLHVVDVNFDGYKDVIILNTFAGAHGNTWYDCWLWDAETSSFIAAESFAEICNPALDAEKSCIYSAGGSGAAYWGGKIYKFIDGEFVVTNELGTGWDGLVETKLVNGKMEIVREVPYGEGDQMLQTIEKEQEYYRNSDLWQLDHPRWYWYGGHETDKWLGG